MARLNSIPSEVDVVVLGGGLAGHCAALAAAESGATIALFEKMARYGGSTVLSGGSFAFAETNLQREKGINDTLDLLRHDLLKAGRGKSNPELVDLYVERQLDTFQWLQRQGVTFRPVQLSSSQSVPRSHPVDPHQLMDALHQRVQENGRIRYFAGCAAQKLLQGADNSVEGVVLRSGEATREVRARRGVLLATGGYSRSRELLEKFTPDLLKALHLGGAGNIGDGIRMAWALGADLRDLGYVKGTFGVSINDYVDTTRHELGEPVLMLSLYRGGIIVNKAGRRFANESISYKIIGDLCLQQPDRVAFQVFDQKIMDQSSPYPTPVNFQGALARGLVRTAGSLADLAQIVGLDATTFQATVERYNGFADTGRDEDFGRDSLGNGYGKLARIDTAPFYVFPCTTAVLSTYSGLTVNTDMQVIDVFDAPIGKLFAAGELTGGLHGETYMSGSSLAKSAIFGRIAGANAGQSAHGGSIRR